MRLVTRSALAPIFVVLLVLCAALNPAVAAQQDSFRVCWSIYAGWMPWGYAAESGIMDKWAEKYGIEVEIVQINDYVESINQYTAGAFDGCAMTNMDALSIPAAGGVDTTALIIGDFSNGNDGVVLKSGNSVRDLEGQEVYLVELSVSHYLLTRALESVGLRERDLRLVNTSDADIVSAFSAPDVRAVVTWNPQLMTVRQVKGAELVFDSGDIPGEIIDLMVVNSETLKDNPEFGMALVGAWYEVMALMADTDEASRQALEAMAEAAGTDLAGFKAQLATTRMFHDPAEAVAFARSEDLPRTMDRVRRFLFDHGLLGPSAPDPDFVGIAFPDRSVLGDPDNVKLRFSARYMNMAATGALDDKATAAGR